MILPVQITFRNVDQSDAIEALVREKAARLETFYARIIGCRVMIETPHRHHQEGDHYHIRISLSVPGGEIVVSREPSLHAREQHLGVEERTKSEEVEASRKHLKVAVREGFETARRLLQDYGRRQRADVKAHQENQRARVAKVFPEGGYGYLETAAGREVYFHRNSVLAGGFEKLEPGVEVAFVEEQGDKGPQASTVRVQKKRQRNGAQRGRRESSL